MKLNGYTLKWMLRGWDGRATTALICIGFLHGALALAEIPKKENSDNRHTAASLTVERIAFAADVGRILVSQSTDRAEPLAAGDIVGCHYDSGATTGAGAWADGGTIAWVQRFNSSWCGEQILAIATTYGSDNDPNPAGVNPGDPVGYAIFADTGEGPGELLWQGLATIEAEAIKTDVPQYLEVPNIKVSGTFYVAVWVWHEAPSQPDGGFPAPMDQSIVMADDAWLFGSPEVPFEQFDPEDPALVYNMAEIGWPTSWLLRSVGEPAIEVCLGDLNGDGVVDGGDLGILLANWGPCGDCDDCPADLTGDCKVDGADLGIMLANWGECPEPDVRLISFPFMTVNDDECPGTAYITADNATPGAEVALYYGFEEGEFILPPDDPCAGTVIDIADAVLHSVARANAEGVAQFEFEITDNEWCEGEPPKPRLSIINRGEGCLGDRPVGGIRIKFPSRCRWIVECRLDPDQGTCRDVAGVIAEFNAMEAKDRTFAWKWCFDDVDECKPPSEGYNLIKMRYVRWSAEKTKFVENWCTVSAKIKLDGCGGVTKDNARFQFGLPLGQGKCE